MKGLLIRSDKITGKGLRNLASHPTLESLHVSKAADIGEAIGTVVGLPSLRVLQLAEAADLNDQEVRRLIAGLADRKQLKSLSLNDCPRLTNQAYRSLGKLPFLQTLSLGGHDHSLTSDVLQQISELTRLENLSLHLVRLDESDLAHLQSLVELVSLSLSSGQPGASIDVDACQRINRCHSLQTLTIRGLNVTSHGIAALKDLKQLTSLGLATRSATDTELAEIVGTFPNLTSLTLSDTSVTNAGIVHVAKLSQLETLWLNGTNVDGDGLAELEGLGKLRFVTADREQIPAEAERRFRTAHPGASILLTDRLP
jgi:hypothetical protein